jgi:dihydrolipoamide dehydrogenase
MTDETEFLVIGGGPGGYHAAIRAAQHDLDVTCVDKGSWGGVCLHWGCIPSKGLIGLGKLVEEIDDWNERGLHTGSTDVDLPTVQKWKAGQIDQLAQGVRHLMSSRGVDVREGTARLTGEHTAEIDGDEVEFEQALVATGSQPIELPHIPFDGETVVGSRGALAFDEVPDSLAVIGGGFIGLEIGQLYHQLGADVTVVEMLDRVLPTADEDVGETLGRQLTKEGLTVHTNTEATGADVRDDGVTLSLDGPAAEEDLEADKLLVAVGREPRLDEVGLDELDVDTTEDGRVDVDDQMRTSLDPIFAIGDIAPGPALAHKASYEGLHAAAVAAGREHVVVDHRSVPWFCYTTPEVGSVGLGEEEARERFGDDAVVARFPFAALGKAKMTGHTDGWVKVVAGPDEELLGTHIVGPDATNLIAEPALGIEMGATLTDVAETVHAHPTLAEAFLEAVEAAKGHPIHVNK